MGDWQRILFERRLLTWSSILSVSSTSLSSSLPYFPPSLSSLLPWWWFSVRGSRLMASRTFFPPLAGGCAQVTFGSWWLWWLQRSMVKMAMRIVSNLASKLIKMISMMKLIAMTIRPTLEENSSTALPSPLLSPPQVSKDQNDPSSTCFQIGESGRGLIWSHSGLYSLHSLVEDDQGLWWENEVSQFTISSFTKARLINSMSIRCGRLPACPPSTPPWSWPGSASSSELPPSLSLLTLSANLSLWHGGEV